MTQPLTRRSADPQPGSVPPVTHARYVRNRTKAGRTTIKPTMQAVYYVGYGNRIENPEQTLRGQWHSPTEPEKHGDVQTWAQLRARQHKYLYTLVVSVRDGRMHDTDFVNALRSVAGMQQADGELPEAAQFPTDWRLMVHRDSDHDHAHVLLFRDRTLKKAELGMWREQIQSVLHERELERIRESARSLANAQESGLVD